MGKRSRRRKGGEKLPKDTASCIPRFEYGAVNVMVQHHPLTGHDIAIFSTEVAVENVCSIVDLLEPSDRDLELMHGFNEAVPFWREGMFAKYRGVLE